ncbi:electron transfer flavoprotein subunit alpha/FixB family protein [Anaeromyxobacter sp. Fw109-5]|uniref:electron transfer flavoprotein subunit alpha/FixB family protein n=1 Tax=Anaeromyxobacter sp. (strain Fw109-5) TaxID=404589 RepID=UPI0000ED8168|nr:electron transfer flavoprotein subunit alpha [Anaeromyxobacter sp. Fw109-5]ABS27096.1 Electron transfer flavoprotein alpha/beta-subunit [Anaeromyxobacter sp. Fw109-5]
MDTVLLLTHTDPDGGLPRAALEALSAARAVGGPLVIGLFGGAVDAAAAALGGAGATKLLAVEGPAFADPRYGTDAAAAAALARASGATVVVAPATSRMARIAAGVAQRLGGRVDTHVTQLSAEGGLAATRWFYKQRIEARLRRKERPWVLLVDPGAYPAAALERGVAPPVEKLAVIAEGTTSTKVVGLRAPSSGEQTIRPDAKLLFVAGAGWTKKQADGKPHPDQAQALILGFLRASGASLGSSKSLVDQAGEGQQVFEFMTHLNQIGQTGATPRHPRGLATCCHGEEPHVVGWRFIRERRAVNLDPGCGWARGKADVLYVADAFAVMDKVNALLGAK